MKELPKLPFSPTPGFDAVPDGPEPAPEEGKAVTGRCLPPRGGNPDLVRTNAVALGQSPPDPNGPIEEVKVICEAKGVRVEYAAPGEIAGGFQNGDCNAQITNIAVISDNGECRFQPKLDHSIETIPYTIWGNKLNVVLRVPAKLKIYDDTDPKPFKKIETAWISYVFDKEQPSTEFQNALMDKKLLLSVRTLGTSRMRSGLCGIFSVDEKLCAMDNLRVWRDDSNQGDVFAMMQCSSQFRTGYLAFYTNGPYNTVHVTDHRPKRIKIEGLTIPVNGKGVLELHTQSPEEFTTRNSRRKKKQMVTGIKVDFDTVEDKTAFLEIFRRIKGPFFT